MEVDGDRQQSCGSLLSGSLSEMQIMGSRRFPASEEKVESDAGGYPFGTKNVGNSIACMLRSPRCFFFKSDLDVGRF